MRYFWLCIQLTLCDLFRLRDTSRRHVVIVAGISLPVLILVGLKNGHVAALREDLLKSPVGRQIILWSAQSGEFLEDHSISKLYEEFPQLELVVPDTQRVAGLKASDGTQWIDATLYPTVPDDPLLQQADCSITSADGLELIVSRSLADKAGIAAGEDVRVQFSRRAGTAVETVQLPLTVTSVIEAEYSDTNDAIGYVPVWLLKAVELYVRGYPVPQLDWPGRQINVRDTYTAFYLCCNPADTLMESDGAYFRRSGFDCERVDIKNVTGFDLLFNLDSAAELQVFRVSRDPKATGGISLTISPAQIRRELLVSNVNPEIIAWNPLLKLQSPDGPVRLLGLSLPSGSWLREYLVRPGLACSFDEDDTAARVLLPVETESDRPSSLKLVLADEVTFEWPQIVLQDIDAGDAPAAVVPADLLARLTAFSTGKASYDRIAERFVPVAPEVRFDKARVYARTIDDVPAIVEGLYAKGLAVMSESSRIAEIHEQNASLKLLVYVVAFGVYFFGTVTVFSVLIDSTDRKRGAIGIMRVMGVSQSGIFLIVLTRAALIGLGAAGLSILAGIGVAWGLALPVPEHSLFSAVKPTINVTVTAMDVGTIVVATMCVSVVGALWPAWRASRQDPFDAIVEGRFK